ncbi:hypothetical protein CW749_17185 [Vibrio sp. vnigr-6D03]|nr:hypothetical protein CW749_17185 [Vibrio sp. vnigr-6D03]
MKVVLFTASFEKQKPFSTNDCELQAFICNTHVEISLIIMKKVGQNKLVNLLIINNLFLSLSMFAEK